MRSAAISDNSAQSNLRFGLQWTFFTAIGFIAGLYAALALTWAFVEQAQAALGTVPAVIGVGVIAGAIFGAGMGLAAITLGGRIQRRWRWVLASALGGAAGFPIVLAFALSQTADGPAAAVLALGAVLGTAIGAAQWLVLRASVRRAALWIVASAFSIGLAMAGAFGLATAGNELVSLALVALVLGAIQAATMIWLGGQPLVSTPHGSQAI